MAQIDHDRLFKELLSTFFLEFVELFMPRVAQHVDPASVVFLDKEVFTDVTAGERHVADLVAKVRVRRDDSFFLVHVETQSQSEAGFPARMFRYFARLYEKYGLPVYPVALFSGQARFAREREVLRVSFPDLGVLRFRFRAVQLNRLRWRDFVQHANPVAAALMARMRIAPVERPRVKAECLRLLATLRLDPARTRLIAGFVDTYLRLSAEEERLFLEQIAAAREPGQKERLMEIVTSWEERGIKKGLERGLAQGRQEEARKLILRQLRRRFGAPAAEVEQALRALTVRRLESLSDALFDFASWADVSRWLARPRSRRRAP